MNFTHQTFPRLYRYIGYSPVGSLKNPLGTDWAQPESGKLVFALILLGLGMGQETGHD
jgi:hypothetical protein